MKGEDNYKKGLWTKEEDRILLDYIQVHGRGRWNRISKITGLKRCGKSCRLRWMNYLSPSVKHGEFTEQEEDLIIRLHNLLGNRWSLIAGRVPGRTDNQVKNHWNSHLCERLGIKKKNRKTAVTSLKPHSTNVDNTPKRQALVDSISKPFHDNNMDVGGFTRRQCPLSGAQVSEEQPAEMGWHCVDSFWASTAEHLRECTPTSIEFLEGYYSPGDAFWQGTFLNSTVI